MAYINKNVSTMAMPSGMNRMGQFPLDMSSVFYNKEELENYASSSPIAYVGQIVSLVDEDSKKVTVYSIQNIEGDLQELGSIPEIPEYIDTDTKTTITSIDPYITIDGTLVENQSNTFTIGINEAALKELIGFESTAAMEFKGAITELPEKSSRGDMYKISKSFYIDTEEDAEEKGFTAKIGDSIVADEEGKWYLIPSGDDIEDTNTRYTLSVNTSENGNNIVNLCLNNDDIDSKSDLIPVKGAELIRVSSEGNSNILIATPALGVGLGIDANDKLSVLIPTQGHIIVNSNNELTLGALPVYQSMTDTDGKVIKSLVTPGTGIFEAVYTKEETNDAIADAVKIATGGESASDVLIELNNYKKKVNAEVWGDENGSGSTVGEQTNQSRIDILQTEVGVLQTKLDSIESGAEKNVISLVDEEKFVITEGKLLLKENYITTTVYNAEVGNLGNLIRNGDFSQFSYDANNETTLVDEINYINERLTWGEITE